MYDYKVCMYLQFWSGADQDSFYKGKDKLWFEILLDEYRGDVYCNTIDCNGFELPLSFMELGADEREAMRDELMDKAATNVAELLNRNNVSNYSFEPENGAVNLQSIENEECYFKADESRFNIGTEPTKEEYTIYEKVKAYNQRLTVASWLEHNYPGTTHEIFEKMCAVFEELCMCDGEHEWEILDESYYDAIEEE